MKKIIGYFVLICIIIGCIVGFYSFTGFYVWSDAAVNSKLVRKAGTFSIHNSGSVYADGEIINATNDTIIISPNEIIIYCKDINTNEIYSYSNALSYTIKKQEKITIAVNILKPPSYPTTETAQEARYIAENYQVIKLEYKLSDNEVCEIMSLEQTNSYFLPLGTIIAVPILICLLIAFFVVSKKRNNKKISTKPTADVVEQPNLGVGKEIIVEDIDTQDDEQARRNEEAMREMQERITRERAEEDEKEQIRQEKRKQSIANLNANKDKLILEYSNVVENFILKIGQKYNNVFLGLFDNTEIPLSSTMVNPYKNQHNLFCDTVKRDGLDFVQSSDEAGNEYLQNIIRTLIQGLKKRINENGEWKDEYTLPVLLYYIVRNNVIKHYHKLYLKEIGCLTIEEFCEKHSNSEIPKANALAYTYYYVYENDINLPFMDTYKKLCADMLKTIAEQKQRKLENDLFGTQKAKVNFTDKTISETLSPIEKVDRMSGQEFEIFMEEFFAKNGYKVERTPLSGDYGVDLIIEHTFGRTGVQLKCYSKKVPADAVQQIVTGLQHYKLSNGMVITNNYFQKEAITLAAENHIELWDRDKLIKELNK